MNVQKTHQHTLEDNKVSVQLKLATLWASLIFLIVYVDYFHLFMPGSLEEILEGRVFVFDITQGFLLGAFATMIFPILMVFLSVALPAQANRWTNIISAAVKIPMVLFNLAGEAWLHMVIGAVLEVILLCLIIYYAWKWPRVSARRTL
jgi:hypothetical protein